MYAKEYHLRLKDLGDELWVISVPARGFLGLLLPPVYAHACSCPPPACMLIHSQLGPSVICTRLCLFVLAFVRALRSSGSGRYATKNIAVVMSTAVRAHVPPVYPRRSPPCARVR